MNNKLKHSFQDLKKFNWNLFIALCFLALIPAIYQTVRTFILSTSVSVDKIDVIGQMEWFDLINETLQAILIIPLYSILNQIFKRNQKEFSQNVFKFGLIVIFLYFLFQIVIFIYANHLVSFMNPNNNDLKLVNSYLHLETIAFIIGIIPSYINVIFVIVGKSKNIYILLVVNAILMIISDFILIPKFEVKGVGYSNILINGIMALISITILIFEKYFKCCWFKKEDWSILKLWLKIGFFSGGQSLIDNIIYSLMIVKMVNIITEQGNYWVANNFIWGWLLIPISALTEIIRRDTKTGYQKLKQTNYYLVLILVFILWLVSIPVWNIFFNKIEQLENATTIFTITLKLFPFYIIYALTIIPDNIFIGLGKTKYSLLNSIIINFIYYGFFFLFYKVGILEMNLNVIIMMFGFGNVAHLGVSWCEQIYFVKKEVKKVLKNNQEINFIKENNHDDNNIEY